MVLEKVKGGYQSSIISLDDVHDCQLVTNSSSITRGSLKKLVEDNAAITVALQFEFNNHMQPVSIIFTNGIINSKKNLNS